MDTTCSLISAQHMDRSGKGPSYRLRDHDYQLVSVSYPIEIAFFVLQRNTMSQLPCFYCNALLYHAPEEWSPFSTEYDVPNWIAS